jgi:alpha-L-fucosidase
MVDDPAPPAQREDDGRTQWFRDAAFGMFITYGLFSPLGHGEWAQWREDIHPKEYARLTDRFTCSRLDMRQWAKLAREAGAKYVVWTAKYADGFAAWDSTASGFNSMRSAARRDLVREYVEAIREEGIKVGLYYSLLDWSWAGQNLNLKPSDDPLAWQRFVLRGPDLDPRGFERFRQYTHDCVRELMSNYGKIDLLWYDGNWYHTPEQWQSEQLNAMVRQLQPHIVINDRAGVPEDYRTPENEIPLNIEVGGRMTEVCMTSNDTWGYIEGDRNLKSPRFCVNTLVRVRSAGWNLLLNATPDGDGAMPRDVVDLFGAIGGWLSHSGKSIYGAGLAEMTPHGTGYYAQPGMMTARPREHKAYYHVLRWLGRDEHCAKLDARVRAARLLKSGQDVPFRQRGRMVHFPDLPLVPPDHLNTVIELDYEPGTSRSAWEASYV